MTTTPSAPPLIAERADIHKSCKAIESLLNLLDDYSQVTSAMATLEKKLAKAIRELAGLKITGEIAANACNVSANVFETSSDISGKFAKIADKEYSGIGNDVRKWFKKLAKEERAHDERLSSANVKIKQAGQTYEKKSRKNTRDATEEHARYINLISILGPEISKDKYEHGISITRQHISTTCGVAACLARIADAEWLRACESIRRFSPSIGPLGEWRALCEGGWERPLPRELPDIHSMEMERNLLDARISDTPRREPAQAVIQRVGGPSSYPTLAELGDSLMPAPLQNQATSTSHADLDAFTYSNQGPNNQSLDSSPLQPPKPLVDPNTGSVRSLSAFPTPPTHFPIPPPQVTPPRSNTFQPTPSGLNPNISIPRTASPDRDVGEDSFRTETPTQDAPSTPSVSEQGEMRTPSLESNRDTATSESTAKATEFAATGGTTSNSYVAAMRHRYSISSGANSPSQKDILRLPAKVADLATRYESPEPPVSQSRAKRPSLRQQSNHVITPANQSDESYFGSATSESSQTSTAAHKEQVKLDDFNDRERQLLEFERELAFKARDLEREKEELDRARRDITKQVPAPSGLSAFAQQLIPRSRERRISLRRQQQSQKLEIPSLSSQTDAAESPSSATQHSYHTAHSPSQQGPAPLTPSSSSGTQQGHHPLYSRHIQQSVESSSHLAQDTHLSSQPPSPSLTRPPNPNYKTQNPELSSNRAFPQTRPQSRDQHPSYCGCERCSAKYGEVNNSMPDPRALRPPEQPIVLRPSASDSSDGINGGSSGKRSGADKRTEKAKGGWMRRLSMPVVMGHALNLDSSSSKKTNQRESSSSSSLYALGAGIGNTPGTKGGLFSLDGKKNASSTNLRFGVREDGKISGRRSYETSILANRSMTNLGLGGKR